MTKTLITLDPEYIPWEDTDNLVPLIRRSNPLILLAMFVLVGGGYLGVRAVVSNSLMFGGGGEPPASTVGEVAISPPVDVAPTAMPTGIATLPPATFSGRAGAVGVRYSSSVMYLPCETWGRAEDQSLSTAEGPLIDYEDRLVIWCDGNKIEVPSE
jgi:hypothetical protein